MTTSKLFCLFSLAVYLSCAKAALVDNYNSNTTEDYKSPAPTTTGNGVTKLQVTLRPGETPPPFDPSSRMELMSSTQASSCLTCGGALTTASGGILYKPFENINANERCVWFIKPPGAKSFTLKVLRLGFPTANDIRVHVTTFRHRSSVTQYYLSSTGDYSYTNVQMIMVTFFTGSSTTSRSGFILEYTSSTSGSISNVVGNVIEVSNANNGFNLVRYPQSGNYLNYELTPIIFKPVNNVYNPSKLINIRYTRNYLEGNCYDTVKLLTFNTAATSSTKWTVGTAMCATTQTTTARNQDMVLVLFESDGSNVGAGFHITHVS